MRRAIGPGLVATLENIAFNTIGSGNGDEEVLSIEKIEAMVLLRSEFSEKESKKKVRLVLDSTI
jgi:hypothetical protein